MGGDKRLVFFWGGGGGGVQSTEHFLVVISFRIFFLLKVLVSGVPPFPETPSVPQLTECLPVTCGRSGFDPRS